MTIDEVPDLQWTTTVDGSGRYGYTEAQGGTGAFKITADDPDTPEIEGGSNGDTVRFFVLDKQAGLATFQIWGVTQLPLNVLLVDLTVTSDGCCPITVEYDTVSATVEAGTSSTFPDIDCGTSVNLTAEEPACCVFDGWQVDGTPVAGNPINVTMNNFHTAVATCHILEYTLTTNVDPVGVGTVTATGMVDGIGTYDCCITVDVEATPADECWYFTGWSDNLTGDTNPESIHIDGNKTVTANFAKYSYTLTVVANPTEGGTVTGGGTYDCCTDQPITATQTPGYVFDNWTGEGIDDPDSANTTVHIDGNKTVTANFSIVCEVSYDLTVGSTAGGSVTDPTEGTHTYCEDEAVDLVAEADPCYKFVNWTGDVANPTLPTTTVTMDGDKIVTANFAKYQYTLTVNASPTEGGTVTGDGTYDCSTDQPITATPAGDCWEFDYWEGEGIADPDSASTTVHIDADKTVTAHFVPAEVDVLMNINLVAGWNTFSTPVALHPCWDTLGELLALSGVEDDVEQVYYYNGSTQNWGPVLNPEHQVNPLDGIFVKLKDDSLGGAIPIIAHPESPVPPSKEVYTGANLIGPAPESLEDEDVVKILITIYYAEGELLPWGYSLVLSPPVNDDDWSVYYRETPEPPTSDEEMQIGRAYWVIMINAQTLWGTSTTPLPCP